MSGDKFFVVFMIVLFSLPLTLAGVNLYQGSGPDDVCPGSTGLFRDVVENTGDTYGPGFTYNTKTVADPRAKGVEVGHFTWEKVERVTGLKVDTVILDCEGCWIDFVRDNLEKFRNVNKIILGKTVYSDQVQLRWLLLQSMTMMIGRRPWKDSDCWGL